VEEPILWLSLVFVASVLVMLVREDWFHLAYPARRVEARVVGHRERRDEGSISYAALLEFNDEEGKPVQISDIVYAPLPRPETGVILEITHPKGMPKRARINRPWLRGGIYLLLFYLLAVLVGRLSGWLSAGSGDIVGL
jgi:hypothetical protein